MNVALSTDGFGRLVCDIEHAGSTAIATSADMATARAQFLGALEDVEQTGYGECLWPEAVGEYRWMFRRSGTAVIVVLLWSRGTLTGWDHLLHASTDFRAFAADFRARLDRLAQPS